MRNPYDWRCVKKDSQVVTPLRMVVESDAVGVTMSGVLLHAPVSHLFCHGFTIFMYINKMLMKSTPQLFIFKCELLCIDLPMKIFICSMDLDFTSWSAYKNPWTILHAISCDIQPLHNTLSLAFTPITIGLCYYLQFLYIHTLRIEMSTQITSCIFQVLTISLSIRCQLFVFHNIILINESYCYHVSFFFVSGQYIGIQMRTSTCLMIPLVQLTPKLEGISLTGITHYYLFQGNLTHS